MTRTLYEALYGSVPASFPRLEFTASQMLDDATTGVDGFRKLRDAYPSTPHDVKCIEHCKCEIINLLWKIDEAEAAANDLRGVVSRGDGTFAPKAVASVSSGSESITFSTGSGTKSTSVDAAASDANTKNHLLRGIIRTFLAGARDANGVNLLYMGEYPYVR